MTQRGSEPVLLVVMADGDARRALVAWLEGQGHRVGVTDSGADAGGLVAEARTAAALIDAGLPEASVLPEWILRVSPTTAVVVLDDAPTLRHGSLLR